MKALARSSYEAAKDGSGWHDPIASRCKADGHPPCSIPFGTRQQ
jgi:hypothetical protein